MFHPQPYPDPLDDLQAVLNSFCNQPDPAIHDSDLETHHLPPNFNTPDFSFFSPKNNPPPKQQHSSSNPQKKSTRKQTLKKNPTLSSNPRSTSRKIPSTRISKSRKPRRPPNNPNIPSILPPSPIPMHALSPEKTLATNSTDDAENYKFIQQMRNLAEQKLQAEKRKREAAERKALKKIDHLNATCEADMRRLAGLTSKTISKGMSSLKRSLQLKTTDTILADIHKTLHKKDIYNSLILNQAKSCEDILLKVGAQLQSKRSQNHQATQGKEKKLKHSLATVSAQRQHFTNVLSNLERMLKNANKST